MTSAPGSVAMGIERHAVFVALVPCENLPRSLLRVAARPLRFARSKNSRRSPRCGLM